MIKVEQYKSSYKESWDKFILSAKNGHFMFCRDYMEYHSDRFIDHSLMFSNEGKLVALLPANLANNILYSHQGLTFGGLILSADMKTSLMLDIVDTLIEYLKNNHIKKLIYKHLPYVYPLLPSQEDLYALHTRGAKLYRVDIASTIYLDHPLDFSHGRKDGIRKALKANLSIIKSNDYETFYLILTETLNTRHNATPTHSLEEIKLLVSRFPENISLHVTINHENQVLAAVMLFEMNHWVHVQYIASSEQGKKAGALDLLFKELINKIYTNKKFFNFGISTESEGKVLNNGLITQKEGFGAMAVVHNFFELNIE